jgi:hypothetical protein
VSAALSSASQAPDKIPYAIQRYFDESLRLISVLDRRLSEHTYLADNTVYRRGRGGVGVRRGSSGARHRQSMSDTFAVMAIRPFIRTTRMKVPTT